MMALGLAWKIFSGLSGAWKLAVIGIIIASLTGFYLNWRSDLIEQGRQEVINEIANRNEKLIQRGLEARAARDDCVARGMRWSTVTGRCSGG
jgi:hypothetical protein